MNDIQRITSFTVDHDKITEGIYVSRIDGDVVTYDLRTRIPNAGDYMDNLTMHSLEHMFATYVRNSEIGDRVIYFGPMGCRTGFYLLMRGSTDDNEKRDAQYLDALFALYVILRHSPYFRIFLAYEVLYAQCCRGHRRILLMRSVALPVAVVEKHFGQIGKIRMLHQAAEQSVVFGRRKKLFIAYAMPFQNRGAHHDGRMTESTAQHHILLDVRIFDGQAPVFARYAVPYLAAHDAHFRMRVEEGHLLGESFRQGDVVVIHHSDGYTTCYSSLSDTVAVKPGDKVIIDKFAGTKVTLEDIEYIVVRQGDILAIVE